MVLEVLKFQFQKEKRRKGLYYSFNSIVSPSLLISQKGMFFSSVNSFMRQEDSKPVVKLKKENNQLVSATTQLKFRAADGKLYNTDSLDAECL